MDPKFKMMKVFSRTDMPDDVRKALKVCREYHNDGNGCIEFHIEGGEHYPDENNLVVDWLKENGAVEDEYIIIDISW